MDNQHVLNNTIFMTVAGSHSYGTNSAESDIDLRGVCILPNRSYYMGMGINKFEQMDKGWSSVNYPDDTVVYDVRKFLSLAADNNPNILDLLFSDRKFWKSHTASWEKIYNERYKFLSKKVRWSYAGYAWSQMKRIQRHRNYLLNPPSHQPTREEFGLPEEKLISQDNQGMYEWLIAELLRDSLEELKLSDETKAELRDVNWIGLTQRPITDESWGAIQNITGATDEWVHAMWKEKNYHASLAAWNSYKNWEKNRNVKRKDLEAKFGYDTKHAMQLVRLMRQGMEILETGEINVYRPDREELVAIRNGAWSYDKIVNYAQECEDRMDGLYKSSILPKQPDRNYIDQLCVNIIGEYIKTKEYEPRKQ